MTVKRFEAFVDNYIWGIESNNNLLIVDPGDSEPIKKFLHNSSDVKIAGILITHHHKDHIGGIRQLINSTNSNFSVSLIPETIERTNLSEIKKGDYLNIEADQQTITIVETVKKIKN